MKTSQKVGMATMLMALTGFGMWSLYKKMNPDYMQDMKHAYNRMAKDVEKSIDDMM